MTFWYGGKRFENGDRPSFVDNEGLRFGATVFTTLRVYEQSPSHPLTQWQAHCDRLTHSLTEFGWTLPNWTNIRIGCELLASHHPILRITIFPDGTEWITGRSLPPNLAKNQQTGVTCWLAPAEYTRSLPTHKTGNYLACWLARQQAQTHGAHEAILTSPQGEWLETSTGNLWGWADGQWFSPMHSHCLPGIMRNRLQQMLGQSGQFVSPEPWSPERIVKFEAIAYSNCAVQLLPVHTILNGATTLKYDPHHKSISALQHQLRTLVERSY